MTPEPESGSHIFPKDNPGPDNAALLRPVLDRLELWQRTMRGDNPKADANLRMACNSLRAAIRHYEAMR